MACHWATAGTRDARFLAILTTTLTLVMLIEEDASGAATCAGPKPRPESRRTDPDYEDHDPVATVCYYEYIIPHTAPHRQAHVELEGRCSKVEGLSVYRF